MRIFLLLVAVVVRPSFDHLHISQLYARIRCLRRHKAAQRNDSGYGERNCGKEAEDILDSHERGVHRTKVEYGKHSLERGETTIRVSNLREWESSKRTEIVGEVSVEW